MGTGCKSMVDRTMLMAFDGLNGWSNMVKIHAFVMSFTWNFTKVLSNLIKTL